MSKEIKKISVVIPCYYSQNYIWKTVTETISVLEKEPRYDYEIILINDGSKDNTFEVIRDLCNKNKKVVGINLARNFGQANATLAALSHVTGDVVVYSDDDGQTPIDEVWKLLQKIEEGHDLVFAKFQEKQNSLFQNFGSSLNNLMASLLIGKPKKLHMGNFWVARRFVTDEIIKCRNPFPYIGGLLLKATDRICDVRTGHRKRQEGNSTYTFSKMLGLWLNGFTAFSVIPLRVATAVGMLCFVFGLMLIAYIFYVKLTNPAVPVGYSSVMSALLFLGGMMMFMLGIIGEYVGRIYLNINSIPQFVVREQLNSKNT